MIHFLRIYTAKIHSFADIAFGATLGIAISDLSQFLKEQRHKHKVKKELEHFLKNEIKDHKKEN